MYLYVKTIERAHTPARMWEKIRLSNNYTKALEQVRWDALIQIGALTQRLDRQRTDLLAKLHHPQVQTTSDENYTIPHQNAAVETATTVRAIQPVPCPIAERHLRPKLVGVKKKLDRREAVRERKALSAAHIERSIEKELLERLMSKAYGDAPLNVNEAVWQAVLDREKKASGSKDVDAELDMVDDESEEDLDEEEYEIEDEREFVSDISGESDDGLSDLEDAVVSVVIKPSSVGINLCLRRMEMMTTMKTTTTSRQEENDDKRDRSLAHPNHGRRNVAVREWRLSMRSRIPFR